VKRYLRCRESIRSALEHGTNYPWTTFFAVNAPKSTSDVIESLLGAVYIDSAGSLEGACKQVLEKIGLLKVVQRLATDSSVDCRQPIVILSERASNVRVKIGKRRAETGSGKSWACKISLDDQYLALAKGASCEMEARSRAAESALEALESLNKRRKREDNDLEHSMEAP